MAISFAIIGGGWYACHIATSFRSLGFDVTVFEQDHRLLHRSSGNNQFRLHLGFHYPRHYGTRMQSRDGFSRFVERYPGLSKTVDRNYYAVPFEDSSIDFLTYKLIMTASGIDFRELAEIPSLLANVEGCLQTREKVLLLNKARCYFTDRLGPFLHLRHRVETIEERGNAVYVDGCKFDFVVDATWGHLLRPPIDVYYEPTLLLYYEGNADFPAVTLVDGPLCSVYPTEDAGLFTLSSVAHTPLGRFSESGTAYEALNAANGDLIGAKRAAMELQIERYVPAFRGSFRFIAPQLSMKTKPVGNADNRSCYVYRSGRIFSVMSGKIDTIFFATERILAMIEASSDDAPDGRPKTFGLRAELLNPARQLVWT